MTSGIRTIVYPVKDLPAARAMFTALLGNEPYVDQPYYVGYRVGEQEVGLDPHGHAQGATGAVCYWHVEDIEASVAGLLHAGATVHQVVKDVGSGKRIASVKDGDGNVIALLQGT